MTIATARHNRRWGTAAACAGALLLAGCGSSGQSASPASSPSPSAVSTAAVSTAAVPSAGSSSAGSSSVESGVTVADTWVKATAGTENTSMTAAFGVLTNSTGQDLTIVSASNDVTDRTELHEMAMVDGAMVMRPVAGGIPIPANGTTTLAPGGLHVMIMDAKTPIAPGDDVQVTLTLSDGSTVLFEATAKEFAGANESYNGGSSAAMDTKTTSMDVGSSPAQSRRDDAGTEVTSTDG